MPNIDLSFAQDPNTLALALIYGMIPAVAWLVFWLHENSVRPRRKDILTYAFIGGALMVIAALPVENFAATLSGNMNSLTILWAASEEILKCIIFLLILRASSAISEPIDYPIYAMVVALGFAGFENALYLLQPLQSGDSIVLLLSGTMRFLGTTLMHAASVSIFGIALGFAHYRGFFAKLFTGTLGLALAIGLHSFFNFYIVQNEGMDFFQVFGYLWLVSVVILFFFEALRRMGSVEYVRRKHLATIAVAETKFTALMAKTTVTPVEIAPFTELLKQKDLPITPETEALLTDFVASLRELYAHYLSNYGSISSTARATALALIPDTVSPRIASGILTTLKQEEIGVNQTAAHSSTESFR